MKTTIKIIIIVLLGITVIGAVIMNIIAEKKTEIKIETPLVNTVTEIKEPIKICYYRADKTNNNYYDKVWLKLNILDEKITGEFYNLPAESDSKIGKFEGTVGPVDKMSMSRKAMVWWDSLAEGMQVKEELLIEFGDGSATVGFGEMIDRGDGVYIYKDKTKLTYIKSMSQIDCEYLDEKLFIEEYIKNNIKSIATNKPVLGGEWYLISINVNPGTKTGEVMYEDGHIQSKANFTYTYENNPQNIKITKFEVK